jgi:DNA-binding NarL/FixJ family response regulator
MTIIFWGGIMKITRVLIVDDNKDVRLKLRSTLGSQYNLEVVGEAVDGLESIEVAKNLHPDLILMDIVMPKMNGLEASKEISQKYPEIIILLLTYYYDEEYNIAAEKNGAKGYIVKTASPSDFIKTIETTMRPGSSIRADQVRKPVRKKELLNKI